MKTTWTALLTVFLTCIQPALAASPVATEIAVLPEGAPWRVFVTCAKLQKRTFEPAGYTPAPPADWTTLEFDDSGWGRYAGDLREAMGGYGSEQSAARDMICLRTRFGVADPTKLTDLTLSVAYRGGLAVHVNGKEIARHNLPGGPLRPESQAEAYPKEAFVDPEGNQLRRTTRPAEEFRDRYEKRIRSAELEIPVSALRPGSNVLALEIHAAPLQGMRLHTRDEWATAGLCHATLTSNSGRGAIAYAKALEQITVSNATPMDTIATKPGRFRAGFLWWGMTITPSGITRGNPFEPLHPVRTVAPRGGTCSGQVVVSGPEGFTGLRAEVSALRHTDGDAAIPAEDVRVRYAHQADYEDFCNALQPAHADGAPVQPVWVLADVPRDQKPGWYVGRLSLTHQSRAWTVPVHVLVSPWTVPDPKNNATLISMYQSPDTLSDHYRVEPWSEAHFKLIEHSFRAMAKSGNDVLLVPVILNDYLHHEHGLVRWVKRGANHEPEYTALEKYLDLHIKYFGRPKIVTLLVWKHGFGCRTWFRGMNSQKTEPCLVTELDPETGKMKQMEAPHFDETGSDKFWKTMIDGIRQIVKQRGCDDRFLLLGEVFDSRPLKPTVDFFARIEPEMRWQGYSHWVREPEPVDGRFVAHGGIEVGFKIGPNGGGLPEFSRNWPEVPQRQYYVAQAERTTIHYESSPLSYRAVLCGDHDGGGTLARIGLDFWPSIYDSRGRLRSRYQSPPNEGWLWRGHCPTLTGPGPDGAVITTRGQMFLEGLQETELAVQLVRATADAPEAMKKRIAQTRARRQESWLVGAALSQATISLDWHALAAREYALAAELAGHEAEDLWPYPPGREPQAD